MTSLSRVNNLRLPKKAVRVAVVQCVSESERLGRGDEKKEKKSVGEVISVRGISREIRPFAR